MKTVKGLLLGSAAALVALTGAHAADLAPVQPVQYVKVCDAYGAGFFYIPGTQTCLRVSGFASAQFRYVQPITRGSDITNFRGQIGVNFDVRSQTPWGTLRGYAGISGYFQNNNLQINQFFYGGGGPNNLVNPTGSAPANGVYVSNAYVQFAGLTAGYTMSNYSFPFAFVEVKASPTNDLLPTLQVAYTASFGNGFSATLALEDGHYRRANYIGTVGGVPVTPNWGVGGQAMPDIVGNLRVIQGWGAAQLSGAVHQIRANGGAGLAAAVPSTDTNYGFAIQGSVAINLPMLGQGDKIAVTAAYANGAMAYLGFGPTNSGEFFTPLGAGYSDAFMDPTGKLHNESGYQITASLKHYWTPTLRSNFTIAYDQDFAPNIAAAPLLKLSNERYLSGAVNLIWSPVPDLDLGLEAYNQTGFLSSSQKAAFPTAASRRAARYSGSKWTVISWITRRF